MIRITVLLLACWYFATACQATPGPAENPEAVVVVSFEESYAAAESALAIAESNRNVWSKTHELLSSARKANDEGRTEEGIKLATEARLQAELAITQAEREKEAWRASQLTQ